MVFPQSRLRHVFEKCPTYFLRKVHISLCSKHLRIQLSLHINPVSDKNMKQFWERTMHADRSHGLTYSSFVNAETQEHGGSDGWRTGKKRNAFIKSLMLSVLECSMTDVFRLYSQNQRTDQIKTPHILLQPPDNCVVCVIYPFIKGLVS